MPILLTDLLTAVAEDVRERVDRTRKRIGATFREALRRRLIKASGYANRIAAPFLKRVPKRPLSPKPRPPVNAAFMRHLMPARKLGF